MIGNQVQTTQSAYHRAGELSETIPDRGWRARLQLEYSRDCDARSYLSRKSHYGPLAVQKTLYPEGNAVCHTLVLHPPGGIVGGDAIDIRVRLQDASQALITMPGAAKWYRSMGMSASQRLDIRLGQGAALEWLPQETIVFNGAIATLDTVIDLAQGASYIGWEVLCMGRSNAGEKFDAGDIRQSTEITIEGELVWSDRCRMKGGSPVLRSPVGMAGAPISAVMVAAGRCIPPELLAQCREVTVAKPARSGISVMERILVARYIGHSSEQAKDYFIALWQRLRPLLCGRSALRPRIWNT